MLLTRRFWLGLIITVGLLFLFVWKVDLGETGSKLKDANYAYFVPAVLVYLLCPGGPVPAMALLAVTS